MRRYFLSALMSIAFVPAFAEVSAGHHPIVVVHQAPEGASARSGAITLLDHDTFAVLRTVNFPMQPRPMGYDATGKVLVVLGQSTARQLTGASTRPWKLFLVAVDTGKVRDLGEVGLPPVGFAYAPEQNRAYLLGQGRKRAEGSLTVVDLGGGMVMRRIPTPRGRPHAVLGPGSRVLFAVYGYGETGANDPEPKMVVYDAGTLEKVAEQALDPSPRRPVPSADGAYVYVACAGRTGAEGAADGALFVFDAATGRLAAKIATGPGTRAITQDPDPSLVWSVATGSKPSEGTVLAVRGAQVESRIAVPVGYGNMYPVPGGKSVLVMGSRAVVEIGTDPIEKVRMWALDFEPAYVTFDPARNRAWVAAGYGSDYAVLDLAKGEVLIQATAGRSDSAGTYAAEPGSLVMTMSPDGKRVFLANTRTDDVTVVDAETNRVEEVVATGGRTDSVLVAPGGSCLYVVAGDALVRIDAETHEAVRKCALAVRSGLAGVVNVHDGVAVVPQASGVEFVALDDGRTVAKREFEKPVDYIFVASPER